jgi:hypothetical protein
LLEQSVAILLRYSTCVPVYVGRFLFSHDWVSRE